MSGRAGSTVAQQSRDRGATRTRQVANNGAGKSTVTARRALRAAELLELVAQGKTIVEAAKELRVSRKTGQELYHEALAAAMAQNNDLRQNLLAQDLETLRQLLRRHMHLALNGDTQAARIVLGILDRRAKLLGLDAAVKLEISNQRIDQVVGQIVELVEQSDNIITPDFLAIEAGQGDE